MRKAIAGFSMLLSLAASSWAQTPVDGRVKIKLNIPDPGPLIDSLKQQVEKNLKQKQAAGTPKPGDQAIIDWTVGTLWGYYLGQSGIRSVDTCLPAVVHAQSTVKLINSIYIPAGAPSIGDRILQKTESELKTSKEKTALFRALCGDYCDDLDVNKLAKFLSALDIQDNVDYQGSALTEVKIPWSRYDFSDLMNVILPALRPENQITAVGLWKNAHP